MWEFVGRQILNRLLKGAGRELAGKFFNDEVNGSEVYADRMKRDFHLNDYADAWALYDSDRAYWERYYGALPSHPDWNEEFVHDSAAATGVPSRNNVFEYGFPEGSSGQPLMEKASPAAPFAPINGFLAPDRSRSFDSRFGSWGSAPAGRFGETRSPVLRALENDRRPAVSDDAASLAATPSPAASTQVEIQGAAGIQPGRYLGRRILDQSPASALGADGVTERQGLFIDRFGNWTSSQGGITPHNPNLPVPPPAPGRPLGIVSGQPMPLWVTPPPIFGRPDSSNPQGEDGERRLSRWLQTVGTQ